MGVTRWLVRVEPSAWDRACAVIQERGAELLQVDEAARVLRDFGREPNEKNLAFLEGADEAPELESTFLCQLLEVLVSEHEWYLDKSLNQLESVARVLPGGDVLLDVIDFRGLDIEPPSACGGVDSGLFGCCSAGRLRPCSEFLQAHTAEAAEKILRQPPTGLFSKFTGESGKRARAAGVLADEYHRSYWSDLRSAVLETVSKGHHLGLGMSP